MLRTFFDLQKDVDGLPISLVTDTTFKLFVNYSHNSNVYNGELGIRWGLESGNLINTESLTGTLYYIIEGTYSVKSLEYNKSIFDSLLPTDTIFIQTYFRTEGGTEDVYASEEISCTVGNFVNIEKVQTGGLRQAPSEGNQFEYFIDQTNLVDYYLEVSSTPDFSSPKVSRDEPFSSLNTSDADKGINYVRVVAEYSDLGRVEGRTLVFDNPFGYEPLYFERSTSVKQDSTTGEVVLIPTAQRGGTVSGSRTITFGLLWKEEGASEFTEAVFQDSWNYSVPFFSPEIQFPLSYFDGAKRLVTKFYYNSPIDGERITSEEMIISVDFPHLITPNDFVLLNEAGKEAKRIHGTVFYDGYIYGSSRLDTGLVRINKNDFTDIKTFSFYSSEVGEANDTVVEEIDQLVRIDHYLYLMGDNCMVQFNTITEEYRTFGGIGGGFGSVPLVADTEYIYAPKYMNSHFWFKFSHQELIDESLPKHTVASDSDTAAVKPVAIYDSRTQGAHIDNPAEYPNSLANDKIVVHAGVADDTHLYLSHTTTTNNNQGYKDTEERPRYELHKVNKHTMQSEGWCFITGATDDMTDSETHLFLGPELLYNNKYGKDVGLLYIDKATLTPKTLGFLSETISTGKGYMALRFGKYLLVGTLSQSLFLLDIDRVDEWDTESFNGQFTDYHFKFKLPPGVNGTANEVVYDPEDKRLFFFQWGASSDYSAVYSTSFSQFEFDEILSVKALGYEKELRDITLKGYIPEAVGDVVIRKGFEFSENPDFLESTITEIPVEEDFRLTVPDLNENTTYYYRTFAEYETGGLIESSTVQFEFQHIYGISGSVFSNEKAVEKVDGAVVLLTKIGENVPTAEIITGVNGEFKLEITDVVGNPEYLISGHLQTNNQPIVPKLVKPVVIG